MDFRHTISGVGLSRAAKTKYQRAAGRAESGERLTVSCVGDSEGLDVIATIYVKLSDSIRPMAFRSQKFGGHVKLG
jgi:hypothetical protein